MPNIDFYLLPDTNILPLACRLAEKAHGQKQNTFILCQNEDQAKKLDDLLWTFHDISFIPHQLFNGKLQEEMSIYLSVTMPDNVHLPVLFNLTETTPNHYKNFDRVIELVANDETAKKISREHYRFYREQGCELKTHQL